MSACSQDFAGFFQDCRSGDCRFLFHCSFNGFSHLSSYSLSLYTALTSGRRMTSGWHCAEQVSARLRDARQACGEPLTKPRLICHVMVF